MGDIVVIVIVLNFVFHFHFFFYVIFQLPYVGSVESFADCLDKVRKIIYVIATAQPPTVHVHTCMSTERGEREREKESFVL